MVKKIRLGELLIAEKIVDEKQLNTAIEEQRKTGLKLGQQLIKLGFLKEEQLLHFLSEQLKVPLFDVKDFKLNAEVVKHLPESYARRFGAIVLDKKEDGYLVGMPDPSDITALDELRAILESPIHLALISDKDLQRTLDIVYRRTKEISGFAEELSKEMGDESINLAELAVNKALPDAPVIKLLQSLFEDAVQVNASDIHIEPGEKELRIRIRVDGILQEQVMKEKTIASAIAMRLKIMSNLNVAEKRLPQDGRFSIKIRDKIIDVRLSTLPIQYGESIVMRLLDQSAAIEGLQRIGMAADDIEQFRKMIRHPHGLVLVTGPTGSGKSTTLYGALSEINKPETKIITVEDPVEYRFSRINQVQVNPKIELDFVRVLRTALRQDPDIIMIGEMRDNETARIAIRAALTGHLVLSTLHTNDSASSALRLVDMDVPGYLVAATLIGVLAQRLVRKVCDRCKEQYQLTDDEKNWLAGVKLAEEVKIDQLRHGKGCAYCNKTGYKGRIGVFELLRLDMPMMEALTKGDPIEFSQLAHESLKGKYLLNKALNLAEQGMTTISEVMRISGEQ
jgi:MSHA biogenesis protein MshE